MNERGNASCARAFVSATAARILDRELRCAMRSRFLRDSCSARYTLNTNAGRVGERVPRICTVLIKCLRLVYYKTRTGANRFSKIALEIVQFRQPLSGRSTGQFFIDTDNLNRSIIICTTKFNLSHIPRSKIALDIELQLQLYMLTSRTNRFVYNYVI